MSMHRVVTGYDEWWVTQHNTPRIRTVRNDTLTFSALSPKVTAMSLVCWLQDGLLLRFATQDKKRSMCLDRELHDLENGSKRLPIAFLLFTAQVFVCLWYAKSRWAKKKIVYLPW